VSGVPQKRRAGDPRFDGGMDSVLDVGAESGPWIGKENKRLRTGRPHVARVM